MKYYESTGCSMVHVSSPGRSRGSQRWTPQLVESGREPRATAQAVVMSISTVYHPLRSFNVIIYLIYHEQSLIKFRRPIVFFLLSFSDCRRLCYVMLIH